MAVIELQHSEISDVVGVLQERGVEFAYSIEKDSAFLYGSEDLVDKVGDILWAADVVQETDFHQEAGVSYAISMQK